MVKTLLVFAFAFSYQFISLLGLLCFFPCTNTLGVLISVSFYCTSRYVEYRPCCNLFKWEDERSSGSHTEHLWYRGYNIALLVEPEQDELFPQPPPLPTDYSSHPTSLQHFSLGWTGQRREYSSRLEYIPCWSRTLCLNLCTPQMSREF